MIFEIEVLGLNFVVAGRKKAYKIRFDPNFPIRCGGGAKRLT